MSGKEDRIDLGWAVFIPKMLRPDILNKRHDDWPWPLKYIPRSLNAWLSEFKPIKLLGTERPEDNLDIPERGKWVIAWPNASLGILGAIVASIAVFSIGWYTFLIIPFISYFAFTTKGGWHFRFGIRYDFVDKYYVFPAIAFKKIG